MFRHLITTSMALSLFAAANADAHSPATSVSSVDISSYLAGRSSGIRATSVEGQLKPDRLLSLLLEVTRADYMRLEAQAAQGDVRILVLDEQGKVKVELGAKAEMDPEVREFRLEPGRYTLLLHASRGTRAADFCLQLIPSGSTLIGGPSASYAQPDSKGLSAAPSQVEADGPSVKLTKATIRKGFFIAGRSANWQKLAEDDFGYIGPTLSQSSGAAIEIGPSADAPQQ